MVRYTLGLFSNMYPPSSTPSSGTLITKDLNRGIFVKRMVDDLEQKGVVVKKAVKTSGSILGYPEFLFRSALLSRDPDLDIIQAEYIPHSSLVPALLRRRTIPFVLKFHGDDARIFPFKNPVFLSITRSMISRADHILTSSQEIRQILLTLGALPDRVTAIHSGVDTGFFSPRSQEEARAGLGLPQERTIFLFIGRLHPWKGVPEIIEVAKQCREFSFVFIGPGTIPPHPENCTFLGSKLPGELRTWLNAADCLLLPTHTEAVPTSVMEAFASGIPAITTDVGGCPEIVSAGVNGLMVPVWDVPALRDAVLWMHSHVTERIAMGKEARTTVTCCYDHGIQTEKLIAVHEAAIARYRASR